MLDLKAQFGGLDIYLFDQLLRGRITSDMCVLDAGCGTGRNLIYLLRSGYQVFAVDQHPESIAKVVELAVDHAPRLSPANFRVEPVESMSFADASMDVVISSAVLHFARAEDHFRAMLDEMNRVLKPGGLLFARLASTIGMKDRCEPLGNRRFIQPDGAERFLVDEELLLNATLELDAQLVDPIKTTVVQDKRCMTTWVIRKTG